MVVFAEPKVKIPVGIEPGDGLPEKALKPSQEIVDLRKLLASVGEEILNV